MLSQSAENVVTEYSRSSHRKYEVKDVKLINVQDAKEKYHLRLRVTYPMFGSKAECMTKRFRQSVGYSHKVRHPPCVSNKLDWSVYTCLTQLYGGIDMYNLLHKELHVSAPFIGHLQVDK